MQKKTVSFFQSQGQLREVIGHSVCVCVYHLTVILLLQSTVPRSQPISMKRGSDHTRAAPPDLSSLSPPSVSLVMLFLLKHKYVISVQKICRFSDLTGLFFRFQLAVP